MKDKFMQKQRRSPVKKVFNSSRVSCQKEADGRRKNSRIHSSYVGGFRDVSNRKGALEGAGKRRQVINHNPKARRRESRYKRTIIHTT